MALDIGRIAYQAYIDYLNANNLPDPRIWEELEKVECDAWRQAACAVVRYLDQCEQDMEDGVIG